MIHVIAWSGGKDSTASIILFHEHQNELIQNGDEVVILFSEVMFDNENQISGINPDVIDFIYEKADIFRSWGYKVEILRSETDYLDFFYHKLSKGERKGMTNGFVLAIGRECSIKRDCKLKPMKKRIRELMQRDSLTEYVGIASDETDRLMSLYKEPNKVSLLDRYGYTEKDAMALCKAYDMVSPIYSLDGSQKRDGCWFCPYAKLCEHKAIRNRHPKAWQQYVSLEDTPDLAYPKWNAYSKQTLHDREECIRIEERQITLFELL